ncbi:MAG: HDIG domain-containing protein [Acidobacteria bacterium]|nr:HDIG domain-containing protein [Acidobacteriota bacterium]
MERIYASRAPWALLFFVVVTPLALGPRLVPDPAAPPAGSVAAFDVLASETREFTDEGTTREVRAAARDSVRPIYDLDSRTMQVALEHLAAAAFEPAMSSRLEQALRAVYARRIVGSRALLPAAGRVTLRDTHAAREWDEEAPAAALSLEEARRLALAALRAAGAGRQEMRAAGVFLQDLVTPNMVFNGTLTESRRLEASARIEPLVVRIPKGKVLLRRGEVVGEGAARTLAGYVHAGAGQRSFRVLLGSVLFVGLLLLFMSRYVDSHRRAHRREGHLFALLVLVTVFALAVDRGFLWLFDRMVVSLRAEPYSNPALYRYMVPMAAGAMLITLLAGSRVAAAYTLFHVPLFGMMVRWEVPLLLYCLISNLAVIHGISGYRRRTAPIQAGLMLGAINAAAILALQGLPGAPARASHIVFEMACGFGGGVLVAVLVSFLLPLLESMFNILTDVRLLELSNLNNPLLRRLAVEAPGSYNHSVIVGTLAEAAAEAIGANALFCRVAAYYHDVGKMLKPSYFIENQREGDNRHDRLSPHMSALVIASHVKEGYELAKSYGLPQAVLDIIPQHHGTRKINYFYQKALQSGSEATGDVQESDYRYPGPKPQTKEAAIFMLSDSIEAAARTLEDPSPARFKGLIRTIVSDVVLDDQLDESDLTFSDLERAEGAFLRTLSSIYHHRIDYPGFDFERTPERSFHGSRTHDDPPPTMKRWGR